MRPPHRTWVLLRGLTRGSGHWGGFDALLRERDAGARVVALDLPGNGALCTLRSPTRIAEMTSTCLDALRTQGIAPPFHVLGVSMGAMVTMDWAQRAPHTLAAGVVVNPSARGVSPWHQRLRPSSWPLLAAIALGRDASAREWAILRLTSREPPPGIKVHWAALREAQAVSPANVLRQLMAAARFRPSTVAPKVPMLVLSSRLDALVDPRCAASIAACWRCSGFVHPWAGHDLTLDDGAWVAARVLRWLDTV